MKTIRFAIGSIAMLIAYTVSAQQTATLRFSFAALQRPATIKVQWYTEPFSGFPSFDTSLSVSSAGEAVLQLQKFSGPGYVQLMYADARNHFIPEGRDIIKIYLVMPGDSVTMVKESPTAKWSGVGAAKYRCMDSLAKARMADGLRTLPMDITPGNLLQTKQLDSILRLKNAIITHFSDSLGSKTVTVLRCMAFAERWYVAIKGFRAWWKSLYADSAARKFLSAIYVTQWKTHRIPVEEAYANAWFYSQYALEKMELDMLMQPAGDTASRYLNRLIRYIRSSTALPEIKSMAMVEALTTPGLFKKGDSLSLLVDSVFTWTKNPVWKKTIAPLRFMATRGLPAFPFRLQGTDGKIVTLESLRGKTLLVDFWFTGCKGCIVVARQLKAIHDSFPPDKLVFVSISIDEDRKKWLTSVEKEIYSEKTSLNLYTNGLGATHPIIHYHRVRSYPTLLLIDAKGNIFDPNPVRPTNADSTRKFIATVRRALQE
jgi:thiol-disulfide isomerase/thioredoxin